MRAVVGEVSRASAVTASGSPGAAATDSFESVYGLIVVFRRRKRVASFALSFLASDHTSNAIPVGPYCFNERRVERVRSDLPQ